MYRGLVSNSRKLDKGGKNPSKRSDVASLHAKVDHHKCVHMRRFPASVWPTDKSGKILDKLPKIADQMWNIIRKRHSNLNEFG